MPGAGRGGGGERGGGVGVVVVAAVAVAAVAAAAVTTTLLVTTHPVPAVGGVGVPPRKAAPAALAEAAAALAALAAAAAAVAAGGAGVCDLDTHSAPTQHGAVFRHSSRQLVLGPKLDKRAAARAAGVGVGQQEHVGGGGFGGE